MLHKLITPSSSERWTRCTGSLELQLKYPQPFVPTQATVYGTEVHGFAKSLLLAKEPTQLMQTMLSTYPDKNPQIQEAWYYHNYIHNILDTNLKLMVERRLDLSCIYPGMQGTPDALVYNTDTLHVIDLKTGMVSVTPKNNTQLMLYAWGALQHLSLNVQEVNLHIYQDNPRAGHNTQHVVITRAYLNEFIDNVKNILSFVKDGIFKLNLGDHCKYCPVQGKCPALHRKVNSDYYTLRGAACGVDNLNTQELSQMYTALKDLLPFQDKLSSLLLERSQEELLQHGLGVKTRRLPLKYTDEQEVINNLQHAGVDIDEIAPRTVLSPTKLKKLNKHYFESIQFLGLLQPQEEVKYLTILPTG